MRKAIIDCFDVVVAGTGPHPGLFIHSWLPGYFFSLGGGPSGEDPLRASSLRLKERVRSVVSGGRNEPCRSSIFQESRSGFVTLARLLVDSGWCPLFRELVFSVVIVGLVFSFALCVGQK